jgi:hypothetical protein
MDEPGDFAPRAPACARSAGPRAPQPAAFRCSRALAWCLCAVLAAPGLAGATLAEKAKESGCVNKPVVVEGTTYKCYTASGAFSYFNVPDAAPRAAEAAPPRRVSAPATTATVPVPSSGFPRVDPATQRSREDMRRKVLGDELATEEKLLNDARAAYANGAPPPLPEEQSSAEKYRQRIARLRATVDLHERNVEALRKELGNSK